MGAILTALGSLAISTLMFGTLLVSMGEPLQAAGQGSGAEFGILSSPSQFALGPMA